GSMRFRPRIAQASPQRRSFALPATEGECRAKNALATLGLHRFREARAPPRAKGRRYAIEPDRSTKNFHTRWWSHRRTWLTRIVFEWRLRAVKRLVCGK